MPAGAHRDVAVPRGGEVRVVCALQRRGGRPVNVAADPKARAEIAEALGAVRVDQLRLAVCREAFRLPEKVETKAGPVERAAFLLHVLDWAAEASARPADHAGRLEKGLERVRKAADDARWAAFPPAFAPLVEACRRAGPDGFSACETRRRLVESGQLSLEAAVAEVREAADAWADYSARLEACSTPGALDAVWGEAKRDKRLLTAQLHRLKVRHAQRLPGPWAHAAELPELPGEGEPDALGFREGALGAEAERAAIQGEGA